MKKLLQATLTLLFGVMLAAGAFAQTYPTTNPTYIPNIRPSAFTFASNVANTAMTLNSVGTMTVQVTGTCTSLNGRLEGSNDGSNWVTLNVYPNQATTVASAATSMTATGVYSANVAGLNKARLNNSGVATSTCVATVAGSSNPFTLPH